MLLHIRLGGVVSYKKRINEGDMFLLSWSLRKEPVVLRKVQEAFMNEKKVEMEFTLPCDPVDFTAIIVDGVEVHRVTE